MVSLQLTISLQKLYEFFNNYQNPDVNRPKVYPPALVRDLTNHTYFR
jgi:hypothetical protein